MIIDQKDTDILIQALCKRKLQGMSQKIFVSASLPEVDTDDLMRQIINFSAELTLFSKDVKEIEDEYKTMQKEIDDEQKDCKG